MRGGGLAVGCRGSVVNRSHTQRAVDAVARANAQASSAGRSAERKWWRQELAKLIAQAQELHGDGAVISASQLVRLSEKRGGDK